MRYGFFTSPHDNAPAYDPGIDVSCPICEGMLSPPIKTISVMAVGGDKSYFYRCHKWCYEPLSDAEKSALDGKIIDHVQTLGSVN